MKTTKKIFSAMLAIALVCCMALTAFAATTPIGITEANTGIAAQKVTKTWTAASLSQMNNTEKFNFELAYVGATKVGTNDYATPVYNDEAMSEDNVKSASITGNWLDQATEAQSTSASNSLGYVDLFSGITFSAPGVYEFKLTEIAGTNPNIDYSEAEYRLKVTVAWATDKITGQPTDQLAILGVVETTLSAKPGEKLDANSVVFPNTAVDNASLEVSKTVKGSAANVNDYFKFTVAISGISGTYDISYANGNTYEEGATNPTTITAVEGAATVDIYLKHGETFEIENLPATATYQVTEEDTEYTESVNDQDTNVASGIINTGATLDYVNTKDAVTPTGVFMDILPYVVMLAVVAIGAGAFVVIRRRREEEQF